ncbi:MAG: hypothetical protein NC110_06100, partial [Ruminococcus sp.]|nr:hypothetical protein [Ruminococcus sp.]
IAVTSAGSASAGGLWYYYGTSEVKNIREILSSNDISVAVVKDNNKDTDNIRITNTGNGHEICVLMLMGDVNLA